MRVCTLVISLASFACACRYEPTATDDELPHLEAPRDLTAREEPIYLRAHVEVMMRETEARNDARFEYENQLEDQKYRLLMDDIVAWQKSVGAEHDWVEEELKQRLLARTPEAMRYRGARRRAVAVGLLALSRWRQDPPDTNPTLEQLYHCSRYMNAKGCPETGRARSLRRMILIGQAADSALFRRLAHPQRTHHTTDSRR